MGVEAIAFATALAGSTIYQVDQQKAAQRDSKRAAEAAERARQARAARERRQLAREAVMARAQAQMAGVASGGGLGSSAVRGASSSITSQAAGNLNFLDNQNAYAQQIAGYSSAANKHQQLAGYGQLASNLSMQALMMSSSSPTQPKQHTAPFTGGGGRGL